MTTTDFLCRAVDHEADAIADQAIARSISHTEIVTLDDAPGLSDQLLAYCDDSVENEGVAEYWGTDDDGNAWRIHIRLS